MDSLIGTHAVTRGGEDIGTLRISQNGNMTVFEFSGGQVGGSGVLRLAGVSRGEYANIGVAAPEVGVLKLKRSFSKSALAALGLEPEKGFFLILSGEQFNADAAPAPIPAPPEPEPPPEEPPEEPQEEPEMPEEPPHNVEDDALVVPLEPAPEETQEELQEEAAPPVEAHQPPSTTWAPIEDPSMLFSDSDIAKACENAKGALTMEKDGATLLAIPVIAGMPFPMMPVFCFGDYIVIDGREYVVFKIKDGNFVM